MFPEKVCVGGKVQGAVVPVVENVGHDFFEDSYFVAFGIQIQKGSLFFVCEFVDTGKILKNRLLQKLLYLPAMQVVFVQRSPGLCVLGESLQISGSLGNVWKFQDILKLLLVYKLALHGPDLCGKPAIGE